MIELEAAFLAEYVMYENDRFHILGACPRILRVRSMPYIIKDLCVFMLATMTLADIESYYQMNVLVLGQDGEHIDVVTDVRFSLPDSDVDADTLLPAHAIVPLTGIPVHRPGKYQVRLDLNNQTIKGIPLDLTWRTF